MQLNAPVRSLGYTAVALSMQMNGTGHLAVTGWTLWFIGVQEANRESE